MSGSRFGGQRAGNEEERQMMMEGNWLNLADATFVLYKMQSAQITFF